MAMNKNIKDKKRNVKMRNMLIIVSAFLAIILAAFSFLIPNVGENAQESELKTFVEDTTSEADDTINDSEKQNIQVVGTEITIVKSDVTETATFYPYQSGDTYMEVIAIRASDGTVRTAFNTCQVCLGSGRAYYKQDGDVLVCQNCGNRFTVDQVEVVKGGCNPIPIFSENKIESADIITIEGDFLDANKELFYNWKS